MLIICRFRSNCERRLTFRRSVLAVNHKVDLYRDVGQLARKSVHINDCLLHNQNVVQWLLLIFIVSSIHCIYFLCSSPMRVGLLLLRYVNWNLYEYMDTDIDMEITRSLKLIHVKFITTEKNIQLDFRRVNLSSPRTGDGHLPTPVPHPGTRCLTLSRTLIFPFKLSNVILRHSSFPHTSTFSAFETIFRIGTVRYAEGLWRMRRHGPVIARYRLPIRKTFRFL